jgi:hypothetical protein
MEAMYSSETSLEFQQDIQRDGPDGTIYNHTSENLKPYIENYFPMTHDVSLVL